MQPEKLTFAEHLHNLSSVMDWWIQAITHMQFAGAINRHKGKHSKGTASTRKITIDAYMTRDIAAGLGYVWEQYGIAYRTNNSIIVIENGRKCWYIDYHVSNNQHWMADMLARAHGFYVVTPPVDDKHRGNSAVAAERGAWKASGRIRKASSLDESIRRWAGNIMGSRKSYAMRALSAPGLRAPKKKKKTFWERLWS